MKTWKNKNERNNEKNNKEPKIKNSVSASQAPTRPPALLISPPQAVCDHEGSAALKVNRATDKNIELRTMTIKLHS